MIEDNKKLTSYENQLKMLESDLQSLKKSKNLMPALRYQQEIQWYSDCIKTIKKMIGNIQQEEKTVEMIQ